MSSLGELNTNRNINDLKETLREYERTTHFIIWHDPSVIANHGHILFNVHVLYDPAVFYTSEEYKKLIGYDVNIRREIEATELYIIGRCKSNDEQLAYIETRIECLEGLKTGLHLNTIDEKYESIILNVNVRLFKGDGPDVALEASNQKRGGGGGGITCLTDDISYSYQQSMRSLENMQSRVTEGKFGRKNSLNKQTCPFSKLSSIELTQELTSRNVNLEHTKSTKKDLLPILKKELRGAKRVPILLLNNPLIDLNILGLSKYEMSMVECMHGLAGHIDNILVELPHHLKIDDKKIVNEILEVYYAEKDKKVLHLTQCLYQETDGKVQRKLNTLSEIQGILYLGDDFRTAKEMLVA